MKITLSSESCSPRRESSSSRGSGDGGRIFLCEKKNENVQHSIRKRLNYQYSKFKKYFKGLKSGDGFK